MFKLLKITNSGTNVPEPVRLSLASSASASIGAAVHLKDGKLTALNGASELLPTHVTLCAVSGKTAICYEVTPNMIFETTVTADPSSMTIGSEYLLSGDSCLSNLKPSGTVRGAVLISKGNATKAGDKVVVAFR